jgi:glycosyltransferase involved in cell wall biosynthesis
MWFPIKAENLTDEFELSSSFRKTSLRDTPFTSKVAASDTLGESDNVDQTPRVGSPRQAWNILKLFRRREARSPAGALSKLAGGLRKIRIANRMIAPREVVDHRAFMNCQLSRIDPDAHRIVYVGELTPCCGAVEFLSTAISWAEANPLVTVEIMWFGEGDILGVLQAQPAPSNMNQKFARIPSANRLATAFAQSGLLVVPNLAGVRHSWIAEAMSAGLPVLGSVCDAHVRAFVVHDENGWLFDPRRGQQMATALNAALTATPERLDEMREVARARVRLMHNEPSGEVANRTTRETLTRSLADNATA